MNSKSIIATGYKPNICLHNCTAEVEIKSLIAIINEKTGEKEKIKPLYVKSGQTVLCKMKLSKPICLEKYENLPSMGK